MNVIVMLLSLWSADCTSRMDAPRECAIPVRVSDTEQVALSVPAPGLPGSVLRVSKDLALRQGLSARLTAYVVSPHAGDPTPPYVQFRFESWGDVEMLCLQSVRYRAPMEVPSLTCTGYSKAKPDLRMGVNLVQRQAES